MTSWVYWLDVRERITRQHTRGYRVSASFESYTGADIILTPLDSIISQSTIQNHLDAGAVMIQVKHSRDFDASVIDQRLFESLLRMNTWKAQANQCRLLITGKFTKVGTMLHIDGQRSRITWLAFRGAWEAWGIRGGFVCPVIEREELQKSIDGLGNKLFLGNPFVQVGSPKPRKKYKEDKQKFVKGMNLMQKIRIANEGVSETDVRHLLVNLDGVSNTTVQAISEYMKAEGLEVNMGNFVTLTLMGKLVEVKGIGAKINERIRKQLGYN